MIAHPKRQSQPVAPVLAVCAAFVAQPSAYPSSSYELMHEKDFPALRIGNRIVVPKEAFIRWVEQHTGGAE